MARNKTQASPHHPNTSVNIRDVYRASIEFLMKPSTLFYFHLKRTIVTKNVKRMQQGIQQYIQFVLCAFCKLRNAAVEESFKLNFASLKLNYKQITRTNWIVNTNCIILICLFSRQPIGQVILRRKQLTRPCMLENVKKREKIMTPTNLSKTHAT